MLKLHAIVLQVAFKKLTIDNGYSEMIKVLLGTDAHLATSADEKLNYLYQISSLTFEYIKDERSSGRIYDKLLLTHISDN